MIKCLYLNKKAVSSVPVYDHLVYTSGTLPDVSFKYKRVTIAMPNSITENIYPNAIKDLNKIFNYKYIQYNFYLKDNNLFLDVVYIDRADKLDYKYAKTNMVFYLSSGKRMKDINKYDPKNKNHLYIVKGNVMPYFEMNSSGILEVLYKKVQIFSAPFDSKITLSELKAKLNKLKEQVTKLINKILSKVNTDVIYLSSKKYLKLGFHKLYRYFPKNLENSSYKIKQKTEVDSANIKVKENNRKIKEKIKFKIIDSLNNNRNLELLF